MIGRIVMGLARARGERLADIDRKLRLGGELEGAVKGGVFTDTIILRLSEYFGIDLSKIIGGQNGKDM